ncbi:uncharacterized protein ACIB01_011730 [Guaruba guarouba]
MDDMEKLRSRDQGQALLFLSPPNPQGLRSPKESAHPTGDPQRRAEAEGRRFEPGFPPALRGTWRSRGDGGGPASTPRHSPAHARQHPYCPAPPPPAPLSPPPFKAGSAAPLPLPRASSHPSRLRPRYSPRLRPCSRHERIPAVGPSAATAPAGAEPRPQGGEAAQPPQSALPLPAAPPLPAAAILDGNARDTHPPPRPGGVNRAPRTFNAAPARPGRRRCEGLPSALMGQDELVPPQRSPHLESCVLLAVIYSLKHNHKPLFVPPLWAISAS